MKRNEFKLLMEDWKKNFAVEGEVFSSTLNEGYTELDRAILEEGIKDMPIVKTAIGLFGVAAISTLFNMSDGLNIITQMVDSYKRPGITSPSQYDPAQQEFFRLGDSYRDDFDKNKKAQNLVDQMKEDWEISKEKEGKSDYEKDAWFANNASEYVGELADLCTVKDLEAIDDEDKKNYLQDVDLGQIDSDQAKLQALYYLAEKFVTKSGYNNAVAQYKKLNQLN